MFGVGQKNAPVDLAAATPVNFEHFTMELIEGPAARSVEFTKAPGANAKWQSSLNGSTGQAPAGSASTPRRLTARGRFTIDRVRPGGSTRRIAAGRCSVAWTAGREGLILPELPTLGCTAKLAGTEKHETHTLQ